MADPQSMRQAIYGQMLAEDMSAQIKHLPPNTRLAVIISMLDNYLAAETDARAIEIIAAVCKATTANRFGVRL